MCIVFENKKYKIEKFNVGPMITNCYIILNKSKNIAAIVDPGFNDDDDKILEYINKNNIKIELVLLTHAHFDHILGLPFLNAKKIYIHIYDEKLLCDCDKNAGSLMGFFHFNKPANLNIFTDNFCINFLDDQFKVMHTPGHTKGSSCFIFLDKFMFSGDTLFKNSIGRIDLFSADKTDMENSIQKINALEKNYQILPGHGPFSTLNSEKINNPYFLKNY